MKWVLAFHIIFVVTWFAGLFYLPRLFVYHAMTDDKISLDRFKIMERKLFYGIMTPSGVLATIFGWWMLSSNVSYYMHQGWMHAKLALVLLVWAYHIHCWFLMRNFKHDRNRYSHVFYRWYNEITVFLLIGIVILVVVQP